MALAIAVAGAGAVGSWFGGLLARAGVPVTLIGRAAHVEAIRASGLRLEGRAIDARVAVAASTDLAAAAGADVVLVAVKSRDTAATAAALAPLVTPDTLVVSLQNGVVNGEVLRAALPCPVIPAGVYVGVALVGPGHVRHFGRGDLVVGAADAGAARVAALFEGAGVPCRVVPRVEPELWAKLLINNAYNALSALTRRPYGDLLASAAIRATMRAICDETLAVARAAGVPLDDAALRAGLWAIGEAMPGQRSSTCQDLEAGRATEIDALNGYVAARAAALGVPAPVNAALAAMVRLAEGTRT